MLRNGFWPISQFPPLTRTQGKMRAQRVRSYWAEAWQNPCQPPVPQMAPVPGTQFGSSRAAQQSGWRPQDSSAGRAAGPSTGKEHSTVCSGVAWSWPGLWLVLTAFPLTPLCPTNQMCRWLLFQPWASCHQVTSSLGAPWLSVGSGRRLCWGNPGHQGNHMCSWSSPHCLSTHICHHGMAPAAGTWYTRHSRYPATNTACH